MQERKKHEFIGQIKLIERKESEVRTVNVLESACRSAKVINVIEVRTIKGIGTKNDPVKEVIQYWSLDGRLIAEKDHPLCD